MLKTAERRIFCYDLIVRARAEHATKPPLRSICAAWMDMFNAKTCSYYREKGTVMYRIGDMDIDKASDIVTILLRRWDTSF